MSPQSAAPITVQRSAERFATQVPWLDSHHCFSFGSHYDPANTHFGLLLVSNDDIVAPGTGFDTHPHRDMEIVTWVLSGSLVHQDSQGNSGVIYPGLAQRMSAGKGILHSEKNDSWRLTGDPQHADPVHFIQMWVLPDTPGIDPGYEQLDVSAQLDSGDFVVAASGLPEHVNESAIRIEQSQAGLLVGRLKPKTTRSLPDAPLLHVFIAEGAVRLETGEVLEAGDSARLGDSGGLQVVAGPTGAQVLVWQMNVDPTGRG